MPTARKKAQPATKVEATPDEKALIRKAYGQATQDLREKHRDDFNGFLSTRAADLGVTWAPKPTAAQRAAEQFDALVQTYPFLAERITGHTESEDDQEWDDEDEEQQA
jgi:hypothetical protein